ncbi:MAG TPA: twin-arginine translocase TatA/TatE family subunit [Beijerinckiaceae bacterium]|nr:twin-arginine translocase TatA/TatE family subunit [Beijerinckiaceae bacterium]
MGTFSIWHWLIVGLLILLLFGGRGKISEMMGDFAKGIKAFKKGMSEDDTAAVTPGQPVATTGEPVRTLEHQAPPSTGAAPAATSPTLGERKAG